MSKAAESSHCSQPPALDTPDPCDQEMPNWTCVEPKQDRVRLIKGILILTDEGIIEAADQQAVALFGLPIGDILGRHIRHCFLQSPQLDIEFIGEKCSQWLPVHDQHVRASSRTDEASRVSIHLTCTRIHQQDAEKTVVLMSEMRDQDNVVVDLKKAREEAEKEAQSRARILAAANFFYISLDEENTVVEWCPSAERLFEIPIQDAVAHTFDTLPIDWNWGMIQSTIERCHNSFEAQELDRVCVRKGELDIYLRLHFSLIFDDTSIILVIIGEEITQRLQLERELAQAQKLESIGQLAAGIAHEINTPTQYVGDNIHFLQDAFSDLQRLLQQYDALLDALSPAAQTREALDTLIAEIDLHYLLEEIPLAISQSLEGVQRIASIVAAMKEFSHPGGEDKVAVDINKALENTATVARNEWKYVAELELNLEPDLPLVACLPGEMNQVFLNLIVNAAHAIGELQREEKGRIAITTRRDGEWVEICIRDTGCGISPEIQDRVFDPFFTTKGVGKGTGQGLSIAHNVVVSKHGGTISFTSDAGKGTTFTIRLPLHPPT